MRVDRTDKAAAVSGKSAGRHGTSTKEQESMAAATHGKPAGRHGTTARERTGKTAAMHEKSAGRHGTTTKGRAEKVAAVRGKPARRFRKVTAGKPVKAASKPFVETPEERRKRAAVIREILGKEFPEARTALLHHSPFQLLVATILSAQCTDERVNMVTPVLFGRYQTPSEFASADQTELESIIRSTGFFRMKAKNIIGCSKGLVERFGGEVPSRMEDLVTLPGVGRKTANVVLGQAFGIASGVVVDTHVHRLAQRMGFSREKTPEKIEADLMDAFPQSSWIEISSSIILHGRRTCPARKPKCDVCVVAAYCPKL